MSKNISPAIRLPISWKKMTRSPNESLKTSGVTLAVVEKVPILHENHIATREMYKNDNLHNVTQIHITKLTSPKNEYNAKVPIYDNRLQNSVCIDKVFNIELTGISVRKMSCNSKTKSSWYT